MFLMQRLQKPLCFQISPRDAWFLVPLVPPGTWFSEKVERSPGIVIEIWLGFHRLFLLSPFISSRYLSSPSADTASLSTFISKSPRFCGLSKICDPRKPGLVFPNFRKMYVATPGKTSYLSSAVSKLFFYYRIIPGDHFPHLNCKNMLFADGIGTF